MCAKVYTYREEWAITSTGLDYLMRATNMAFAARMVSATPYMRSDCRLGLIVSRDIENIDPKANKSPSCCVVDTDRVLIVGSGKIKDKCQNTALSNKVTYSSCCFNAANCSVLEAWVAVETKHTKNSWLRSFPGVFACAT